MAALAAVSVAAVRLVVDSGEEAAVPVGNRCPGCGAEVPRGAVYCGSCGYELAQAKSAKGGGGIAMKVVIGVLGVLLFGAVIFGGCVYTGYNKAVRLEESVKVQWAQVENQLKRRYDLVPNLVETVKGVAGQEEKIYLGVAEARKAYFQADSVPAKAKAASGLESALSRLLVLRETYPELKSNESFLKLQDSLEGSENRIANERRRYNEAVGTLNSFVRSMLGRFYAGFAGVERAEFFEIEEEAKTVPKVDFSSKPVEEPASQP